MQKIYSLLLLVLAGQTIFAGKNKKDLLTHAQAVAGKYHLMTREPIATSELSDHRSNHQGETIDTCAWQALRKKCQQLSLEKQKYALENEELRRLLNKQQKLSSSESSPNSTIAISPTNGEEEQRLLSPDQMRLSTPESKITQSPMHLLIHLFPGQRGNPGMSPGIPDLTELDSYDIYLPAHSDCP